MYVSTRGEYWWSISISAFSWATMRSTTASTVLGAAACAAAKPGIAANVTTAQKIALLKFIRPSPKSKSQLEYDVNYGRKIDRMAILNGRLEANLLSRSDRRFVQSVPQSFGHALNLYLPTRQEDHIHQNFALDSQASSFIRVLRLRLGQEFNRRRLRRLGRCRLCLGRRLGYCRLVLKAALFHSLGRFALPRCKGRAASKSSTHHPVSVASAAIAADAGSVAVSAAVSGTRVIIEPPDVGDVDALTRIGRSRQSMRVAEASSSGRISQHSGLN